VKFHINIQMEGNIPLEQLFLEMVRSGVEARLHPRDE